MWESWMCILGGFIWLAVRGMWELEACSDFLHRPGTTLPGIGMKIDKNLHWPSLFVL